MYIKLINRLNFVTVIIGILFVIGCESNNPKVNSEINIIPEPLEIIKGQGYFELNENTQIIVNSDDESVKGVAKYFADQLNLVSGYSLKSIASSEKTDVENVIEFSDKNIDSSLESEGYELHSYPNKITLKGTSTGLFYAVQTLFQLLPTEVYNNKIIEGKTWSVPSVTIKDKPRFKWRGMHLDVGRHLFPVSFIKKYIDYIAMHKMNVFHWHLTEDQGWRIEIKKYPLLTEISSNRKGSQIPLSREVDTIPYGGFYTQDEIREVVAYANKKFVTIVPEIELPGHSIAVLAAYPELSCTGGPFEVRTKWGIDKDIYCAGNETAFTFLENVLTEVLELFPSEYIHIGGDEAPKDKWKECSKCQSRIKKENLKDEHELQSYFIARIEKFINSKGRKIIGWDEILEGGLAPNAAVMSWRGTAGGITAAKLKHNVVMTPADYLYFCWYQGKPENEPPALGGFLPIEKVYGYEPMPEELSLEEQKYIMGVQACLWTENVDTPALAEYMVLPRLSALSEISWSSKENKNLDFFIKKMNTHYDRLGQLGVNYRWPRLEGFHKTNVFIGKTEVVFISKQKDSEIRYTTDGSTPTVKSILYKAPFSISESVNIKLIEVSSKLETSRVYSANYIKQEPLQSMNVEASMGGLKYQYFEFEKDLNSVNELKGMAPITEGLSDNFVYPFKLEQLPEKFGLNFRGFIKIPSDGIYTFSVFSNDGSRLYIADQLIVDNDGAHGAFEKEGGIALKTGFHKIELDYFQSGGGKKLQVFIKREGTEKVEITSEVLGFVD